MILIPISTYSFIHTVLYWLLSIDEIKTSLNLYTLPCQWRSRYKHSRSVDHQSFEANSLRRNWSDVPKVKILARRGWYWRGPHTPMTSVRMTSDEESFKYIVTWVFPEVSLKRAMQCCCCATGDRFCIFWILNIIITSVKRHQCFTSNFFSYSHPDKWLIIWF